MTQIWVGARHEFGSNLRGDISGIKAQVWDLNKFTATNFAKI